MSSTSVLPTVVIDINYSQIQESIRDFLLNFKTETGLDDMEVDNSHKYLALLQQVANRKILTIYIDLDDVYAFQQNFMLSSQSSSDLISKILQNTNTFLELFSKVIDELMPEPTEDIGFKHDVLDVILHQRKVKNTRLQEVDDETYSNLRTDMNDSNPENPVSENLFPASLTRRYHVYFKPLTSKIKYLSVRDIKGSQIGHYISVRGIITRVSDVKPLVLVNAYTCDKCGYEIFQEVYSKTFTPLKDCNAPICKSNNNKGQLFMSTRASKFSSFQEVKMQELSNQVPIGHIPRSLTIHVNGDLVRSMNPGDTVDVSGIFMPAPYTGFRAIKAGLLTETYLEAQFIKQHKKQYDPTATSEQIDARVDQLIADGDVYNKLAKSIAPEIYGHLDIKKVLLLLLCGGVTKEIGDGLKIRGDINVCLMGDPGVAKSQLLKAIGKIAPRSVYTTGRGSSGVGLTAAVMRDPVTDEMVLEGGALVLADNGICCIDEFDKMEESDRTAIHEVMEQQTISIAKAGITTTLNARTSILAAANPLYGRYNTRLSPHENINLPAALLSRFDIMFLILDQPGRESDEKLAQHVAYVHMHNKQPPMDFEPLDSSTIRAYINRARSYRPIVPKDVGDYVVQSYINMRKESHRNEGSIKKFSHITPRTLLGILRLAQANARLRLTNQVSFEDIDEALRIIEVSKSSLYVDEDATREDESPTSKIYQIIRNISLEESQGKIINMDELKNRILGKGFNIQQFDDCIVEYDQIGVWQTIDGGESLMFIDNMEE